MADIAVPEGSAKIGAGHSGTASIRMKSERYGRRDQ
jgi:hypothetical protein